MSPPSEPTLHDRDQASLTAAQKLRFFPLETVAGHGSYLVEPGGRRLLDLSASWSASGLGHGHPAVVEAVTAAVRTAPGAGAISAAHPDAVLLAEELLEIVPGGGGTDRRVYLGHAGSDANDVALRSCRHATGRSRVIAFEHSYHGGLGLAQGVSGVQVDAGAAASPDAVFVPYPDPLRPHRASIEESVADALARAAAELATGEVAAVIVEPILADGGLVVPPPGFLADLARLAREHDTPLICDEVKVGLGRTGLLHCFEHEGIEPDLVTFGKSLGGGLPLSAVVGPASVLDEPAGSALLTTAGNPVCAAAGRAVLRTIRTEGLTEAAAVRGEQLRTGLVEGFAGAPAEVAVRCGEVRGRGLALGIDLVTGDGLERDADLARRTVYRAWQLGAVVFYVGGNVIELTPPLVIGAGEVDQAVSILVSAVTDAVAGVVSAEEADAFAGW